MNAQQLQDIDSALSELAAAVEARDAAYQDVTRHSTWKEAVDAVHTAVRKATTTLKQYGYRGKVTHGGNYFIHPDYITHYNNGLYEGGTWDNVLGAVPQWAVYTINW